MREQKRGDSLWQDCLLTLCVLDEYSPVRGQLLPEIKLILTSTNLLRDKSWDEKGRAIIRKLHVKILVSVSSWMEKAPEPHLMLDLQGFHGYIDRTLLENCKRKKK